LSKTYQAVYLWRVELDEMGLDRRIVAISWKGALGSGLLRSRSALVFGLGLGFVTIVHMVRFGAWESRHGLRLAHLFVLLFIGKSTAFLFQNNPVDTIVLLCSKNDIY
jgi:hypothetical protein